MVIMCEAKSNIENHLSTKRGSLIRLNPYDAYRKILNKDGTILIDTRPQAYREAEGIIPGAIIIERNVLEWRLDSTSPDCIVEARQAGFSPIIMCNEGFASSLAAHALVELGVKNATDLKGGFRAWKGDGLPVVLPSSGFNSST